MKLGRRRKNITDRDIVQLVVLIIKLIIISPIIVLVMTLIRIACEVIEFFSNNLWLVVLLSIIIISLLILIKRKELADFYIKRKLYNFDIDKVDMLDGYDFEQFSAMLLKRRGFTNISVTKQSGDFGADIIAYKDGYRYAVQCKCHSNRLGQAPVREVVASLAHYNADKSIVITNNYYTSSAIILANDNQVELWDRNDIIRIMSE